MAKNKKREDGFKDVEETLTRTEQFLENHLNLVLYVIVGIIIVILGFLGIQRFHIAPKNVEAQEQMFQAQIHFSNDNFELALNGDGMSLGFLDIIDDYSRTKAGKLSRYYAGISYLHLGEYELAIDYLSKFKTKDILLSPLKQSAIGDAHVELGNYKRAISAYNNALKQNDNNLTTPFIMSKLALVHEAEGDKQKALEILKDIRKEYPNNTDAVNVEKNIARLQQK